MTEKPLTQAQKEKAGLQPAVPRITQTVWPKASPSGAYYVQEGEKYTLVNPPPYQPAVYGDKPWAPGDLTQMPNYEKTSGGERWLLRALPGFAQSDVGQALAAFGNTWAGKALGFFDVLAEGLERGVGVGVQAAMNLGVPGANKQLLEDQLKSAWYAGSLTADYANTTSEFGIEDGKPYWRVPQDLPGAAGLVEARQSIYRLVQQGMSYSDALEKVRADSYTKAGALAIRMQANDLVFHIFGDPLNIVAGWIKPVERISAAKILGQGRAIPSEVKAVTEAADAARLALREAEAAGDTAKATELAQSVGLMEEGLAELGRMKQMSPLEQRFLRLVGGMPGEESWVNKLPQPLRWIGKQFTLTPEARAYEYVDNIQRNVISYVFNQAKDPYEAVRSLQRLAAGTLDRQLAHMVVTPQGRAVRGVAEGMASRATQMLGAYDATTFERQLLDLTAVVLQEPSGAIGIMNRLRNGEAKTIAALLSEKIGIAADGPQTLERLLGSFQHTADELPAIFGRMPVLFDPRKGLEIYTPDLFFHHMTNMVADVASEVGVKMFGVKSRGTLLAASEALKSAETLAFLRVNPAYPVMNFVNNEMTMLARGAYGTFTMQFAEDLWTRLGFIPPRLRAGVGMSGMAENLVQDAIGKMSRTAEKGSVAAGLTNFADWMKGRNLGGFDMGQWAQAVERNASLRAYTAGYLRGNRMFSKAFTRLVADFDPALAKSLGDDLTKVIEDAVRGSMTQKELDAALLGDNLRVNMSSIMDGASQRLGYDIDRVLSTEFTASIERELLDATRKSPAAVRDALAGISGRVQQHIDALVEEGIKNLVAETAAKVELEGPGAFAGLWGNITDEFYFAHPKHADNVRRIAEAVEAGADPKAIDLLWRKGLEAEDRYMGRM